MRETDRHDQVMTAFDKARAECAAEDVFDEVLAAVPGLTDQSLNDHLMVDLLLHLYAERSRH
jgi:hypothetical protein